MLHVIVKAKQRKSDQAGQESGNAADQYFEEKIVIALGRQFVNEGHKLGGQTYDCGGEKSFDDVFTIPAGACERGQWRPAAR